MQTKYTLRKSQSVSSPLQYRRYMLKAYHSNYQTRVVVQLRLNTAIGFPKLSNFHTVHVALGIKFSIGVLRLPPASLLVGRILKLRLAPKRGTAKTWIFPRRRPGTGSSPTQQLRYHVKLLSVPRVLMRTVMMVALASAPAPSSRPQVPRRAGTYSGISDARGSTVPSG
jgi:hypothetical protein